MIFNRRIWFILCIVSIACIPITIHFFPIAFPIISLNITMHRTQALEKARNLAEQYHFIPNTFEQAAIFHLDDDAKTFIELDGGGKDALMESMQNDLYMPYLWVVRHFQEGNPRTTLLRFKPDGTPYGFEHILPLKLHKKCNQVDALIIPLSMNALDLRSVLEAGTVCVLG